MSPAPRMSGSPTAVSVASHSSPGFSCRPLPASHSVFGSAPSPTTTRSAATREPSVSSTASTRPAPCSAATPVPRRRSTPWSRCSAAHHSPQLRAQRQHRRRGDVDQRHVEALLAGGLGDLAADEARAHDRDARAPLERGSQRDARRRGLRRTWTPSSSPPAPGQRRALDPVARISRSYGTSSPSESTTRRRARSRLVADTPRRHCASSVSQGKWTRSTSGARRPAPPSTAAAACTAGGARRPPSPDLRRTPRLAQPAPPAARRAMPRR